MNAHIVAIVVRGRLGPSLIAALGEFDVEDDPAGMTRITGVVPDQPMLLGILEMLDGLHIEVVSVNRLDGVSSLQDDALPPPRS